ncbi:MAG: hypothetical protein Q9212_003795 [Teloschistes hypoglaucus]
MASPTSTTLTAIYTSPSHPVSKPFTHALPSPHTNSLASKTAYLSTLRETMTQLQDNINAFLTEKMGEDKALAAKVGVKFDEKKEEDFYGEENIRAKPPQDQSPLHGPSILVRRPERPSADSGIIP